MAKSQISIRIDADDLAAIERIGQAAKPVPANRNEMIGAAVREYVQRHGSEAQPDGAGRVAKAKGKGK
jgi:metal-responsive CopG/Arc/MetJ family transcriptional regulator